MDKLREWVPGKLQYKNGNIIDATEQYIIAHCHVFGEHFNNLTTEQLFKKFQYADIYKLREVGYYQNNIGTIQVMGNGTTQRYIINLFAQQTFEDPTWISDEFNHNYRFFVSGMNKTYKIKNIESVAIHEHFGSWNKYIIDKWPYYIKLLEKYAHKFPKVRTVVYTSQQIL